MPGGSLIISIENVSDARKQNPGGLVVKNTDGNDAPRIGITLSAPDCNSYGNAVLSRSNTKVKVWDATTGGNEIVWSGAGATNKWPIQGASGIKNSPVSLWVEGVTESSSLRDVQLTLTDDTETSSSTTACTSDYVKFTVLWITLSARFSGDVSADNSDLNDYTNLGIPTSSSLGYRLSINDSGTMQTVWNGRSAEVKGVVAPSAFNADDFFALFEIFRSIPSGYLYSGDGSQNPQDQSRADDTDTLWQDKNPAPNGNIYSLDQPGITTFQFGSLNEIRRFRVNFTEYVHIKLSGTTNWVRCSNTVNWFTRQSYKRNGVCDSGTVSSATANTLTDTTKSWGTNVWAAVPVVSATGGVQTRRITGNTGTQVTVSPNWGTTPSNGNSYELITGTSWAQWNDVANDNTNGTGTTGTNWNSTQ